MVIELLTTPEFYDIFGLPVFLFITILSIWMLWKKEIPDKKYLIILLIIGILGLIVDGLMVTVFGRLFSMVK